MKGDMIQDLLAKSDGTTLIQHTGDVLEAIRKLFKAITLPSEIKRSLLPILEFACIMHDIGKSHPIFQGRMKGQTDIQKFRHEVVSAWIVSQFFDCDNRELFGIITHHKGIIDSREEKGRFELNHVRIFLEEWLQEYPKYIESLPSIVSAWTKEFNISRPLRNTKIQSFELPEILVEYLRKKRQTKVLDPSERREIALIRALLMAADHIASGHMTDALPFLESIDESLFQPADRKTGEKYPFRQFQVAMGKVSGDALLHAPTGSGKTEAALQWVKANHVPGNRVFYVLPYMASINAMTRRLMQVFGESSVTALHSSTFDFFYRQLQEEDTNLENDPEKLKEIVRTLNLLSKELFFPVKISTPHQILKRVLMGKGWEFSLVDFNEALFIFDEFHAYDPFLTGLIFNTVRLLKRTFHARILFLSATIPEFLEKLILDNIYRDEHCSIIRPDPGDSSNREILDRKRHSLHLRDGRLDDSLSEVLTLLKAGRKVLLIVNTVKGAQNLYDAVINLIGEEMKESDLSKDIILNIQLLHGGFNKRDRERIEKRITSDDPPALLIATQAVEVSLDMDYDVGFIENAPIDALIQRFGRVNRKGLQTNDKGEPGTARINLFHDLMGDVSRFYSSEILERTWTVLQKYEGIDISEADLVQACNEVYSEGYNSDDLARADFEKALHNDEIENYEEEIIAGSWQSWIDKVIENQGSLPIEILCGNLIEEYDSLIAEKKYIEASQLTVRIRPWLFLKIKPQKHQLTGMDYSYRIDYDPTRGYSEVDDTTSDRFL